MRRSLASVPVAAGSLALACLALGCSEPKPALSGKRPLDPAQIARHDARRPAG